MSQSIERKNPRRTQQATYAESSSGISTWTVFSLASIILLLLLIIGTYTFNWTWTGFRNNTLWDWLQLLVLPVVLTGVTAWFSTNKHWNMLWTWCIVLAIIALLVCMFGGYFLNWTWTGFHNNTLWDWLKLLVLPTVLTAVTIWFSTHMNELSGMMQVTNVYRQNAFSQRPARTTTHYNQAIPDRDVEYNDSTVLIHHAEPIKRIHQDIAENLEKPVDND